MLTKNEFECLYKIYDNAIVLKSHDITAKKLENKGLIKDNKLTSLGLKTLDTYKIDNALILAAGFSSRFVPICFDIPKGLLAVKGEILIERQIKQLKEKGINDISIVIGYYSEQFDYLKDKFGVRLIINPDYNIKNNYASVYAAKDFLKNTIITSSDLYFSENIFQSHAYDAYYTSIFIEGPTEERGLCLDKNDKMIGTFYGCADVWVTLGHAFFSKRFSDNYIRIVEKIYNDAQYANKFWADIQDEHLSELFMYAKKCQIDDIHEFDSLEELWDFDKDFKGSEISKTLKNICEQLNCSNEREITHFKAIKNENLAIGCSFIYKNQMYIYYNSTKTIINKS